MMGRVLRVLFLFFLPYAWAASNPLVTPCELDRSDRLEIEGLGVATFGALRFASSSDSALLTGGVCIRGEGEWRLEAARVEVQAVSTAPVLLASGVRLLLPTWTLRAATLRGDEAGVSLEGVHFSGEGTGGTAQRARYVFASSGVALTDVEAESGPYRVQGAFATLEGDVLEIRDAAVTTCEGSAPFYSVRAPVASIDLVREQARLQAGRLEVVGAEVSLGNVELSEETFDNVRVPLEVVSLEDAETTLLSRVPLGGGLAVTSGVAGLDSGHAPRGVALLEVARPGVEAAIGLSPLGPQADLRFETPILPGLEVAYGIRNREWEAQEFLHEGYVALEAEGRLTPPAGTFSGRGVLTAAVSNQRVDGVRITSPRFGVTGEGHYTAPETSWGRFGVRALASVSLYTDPETVQYGVRIAPSWTFDRGALDFFVVYEGSLTNGASPFSTTLDRLEPESRLSARLAWADVLGSGVSAEVEGAVRADFLARAAQNESALEELSFEVALGVDIGTFSLTPSLELALARALSRVPNPNSEGFLAAGLALSREELDFGVRVSYSLVPGERGFDGLELLAEVPVTLGRVTLQPFLAVDVYGPLFASQPLDLTGHGLTVVLRSCCGTLIVGYRQYRDDFETSLAVRFRER